MLENIEEIYRTLAPKLTNYLVASGSTYANACELVQESFLKLWKQRETVDNEPSQVSGLLWTIARNLRTDRFRHEKRTVYDPEVGLNEEDESSQGKPLSELDRDYLRGRIQAALETLPPLLREAYTLFHIAELSVREVAQQMNTTEDLVKVRIYRAKQKLQAELKDLKDWGTNE